jgi:hypothetical protein
MLRTQDLETFTQIGDCLWADRDRSRSLQIQTLSAASLQDLTEERMLERATSALLLQATRGRLAATPEINASVLSNPFYRLEPFERLILTALHRGHWSYARLARVLGETSERVEELAWTARVNLATSAIGCGFLPGVSYPSGAPATGPRCPEYSSLRPWTQRFLDEEVSDGSQRLFFQNHLMACDSCRAALGRCREFYYAIEKLIPPTTGARPSSRWIDELTLVCRQGDRSRQLIDLSFLETLQIFVRRRTVQWVLCFLGGIIALWVSGVSGR